MKSKLTIILFCIPFLLLAKRDSTKTIETDFEIEVSSDIFGFFSEGLYEGQEQYYFSLAIQPKLTLDWDDGDQRIIIDLFKRITTFDDHRTPFDIRELYYNWAKKNYQFSVGFKKIYWGVTESVHLVDVINQTDQVESFDGEAKLGQPMLHFTTFSDIGTVEIFFLPYHRWRTLPGERGRLRFPVVIDPDRPVYATDAEAFRPGFAVRYSTYFSVIDVGLSYIDHINRDFLVRPDETGEYRPVYETMRQIGVDIQATTGAMLWKLEAISRYTAASDFVALAFGGEYTFSNIKMTGLDIGVLAELLYDDRDPVILNPDGSITGSTGTIFQQDLFLASRLAFNDKNDSSILFGTSIDLEHSSTFFSMEAERRFFNNWKGAIELRLFDQLKEEDFLYFLRQDSYVRLNIARFF